MQYFTVLITIGLLPLVSPSSLELQDLKLDNEAILQKLRDMVAENKILRDENDDLKDSVTALEERVSYLDSILSSLLSSEKVDDRSTPDLEVRVGVLEAAMAGAQTSIGDIEVTLDEVENDLEDQDDWIRMIEGQILGNDRDIEKIEDDFSSLEEITSRLDDMTSRQDVQITLLDARVEQLETNGGKDISDTIFFATLTADSDEHGDPVIFPRDVINPGGCYDNTTGYYTAPSDGIYQFHVQMTSNSEAMRIFIYVDERTLTHYDYYEDNQYRSANVLLELQAGQTVHVYRFNGARGGEGYYDSYFWGQMISAL